MVVTNENIAQYISGQIDCNIEFKYGTLVDDVLGRIICGFANTSGGILVFGYSGKKELVLGYKGDAEKKIKKIMENIENAPQYEQYCVDYQGSRLSVLEIEKNKNCLSLYRGIAYVYKNNECYALSGNELMEKLSLLPGKYIQEMLPQMQDTLIELKKKTDEYELGLARSDKKALKYCIVGVVGGAILSNIPIVLNFFEALIGY